MMILRVVNGPDKGRIFELPENDTRVLGRGDGPKCLSDTTTSRRHSEFISRDGRWYLNDLGSTNGTYVNGQRIAGEIQLHERDHVQMGCTLMAVSMMSLDATIASNVAVVRPQMDYFEPGDTNEAAHQQAPYQPTGPVHPGMHNGGYAGPPPGTHAGGYAGQQPGPGFDPSRAIPSSTHMPIVPYQYGSMGPPPPQRQTSIFQWIIILVTLVAILVIVLDVFLSRDRQETAKILERIITQTQDQVSQTKQEIDKLHRAMLKQSEGEAKHLKRLVEDMRVAMHAQNQEETQQVLREILTAIKTQPKDQEQRLVEEIRTATQVETSSKQLPVLQEILTALKTQAQPQTAPPSQQLLAQILEELKTQRQTSRHQIPTLRNPKFTDNDASPEALAATGANPKPAPEKPAPDASVNAQPDDGFRPIPETVDRVGANRAIAADDLSQFKRVIFLVDASGSLIDSMPRVAQELNQAIDQLKEHQSFSVIFFQGDQVIEVPPMGLKRASTQVKQRVAAWANPSSGHIVPTGSSNPIDAINLAMTYEPGLIYIYSDTITGSRPDELDHDRLLTTLNEINHDQRVTISTTQFFYDDPHETLKTIAVEHGGWYRFVQEVKPVQAPLIPLSQMQPPNRQATGGDHSDIKSADQLAADELSELLEE